MRIAYFDCFNGAGGDMIVAALTDAGADNRELQNRLARLGLDGYRINFESLQKQGFAARRFSVDLSDSAQQPHRHLKHIVDLLERADLTPFVRQNSILTFQRLAEAEARVHGTTVERVHFHEVGAVDAVLDIVGSLTALEMLDVSEVRCSPLPVGSGTVICSHGVMPVPAPATAELLKGVPLAASDEPGELLTPTAAALFTVLSKSFGAMPAMTVDRIGYGAGRREGLRRPNLLRVFVGGTTDTIGGDSDEITVLETNIDDCSAEVMGHCMERLLKEGALDVYAVPIVMKKSRPGVVLTVLCDAGRAAGLERILFSETTTFGIRRHAAFRSKMVRRFELVETRLGTLRMKLGEWGGVTTASPEYSDCKVVAEQKGVPIREVMAAAHAAWAERSPSSK